MVCTEHARYGAAPTPAAPAAAPAAAASLGPPPTSAPDQARLERSRSGIAPRARPPPPRYAFVRHKSYPAAAAVPPHSHVPHDAMQSWSACIESVVEETPLISLRTGHTRAREHTRTLLFLYAAVFLLALAASLDSMSFNLYLNYACSEFQALSSVGTVMIAQQLVRAISKPPLAHLADALGRITTLATCMVLYAGGYAVMAFAQSFQQLVLGTIIQSLGATGVGVLQAVIMADTSSPQWRGFVIGLVNLPYLLNFALTGPLVDATLRAGGWRLGFSMWVVLVPLASLPLLCLLIVGRRRAARQFPHCAASRSAALHEVVRDMDILGTILLSAALTLIMLPLSFAGPKALFEALRLARWDVPTGAALIAAFAAWERRTDKPLFPRSMLTNFTVNASCVIAALDFAGFYLSWAYLSPFIQILKNWDQVATAYFVTTQNITSTITGVVVGMLMAYTRTLKRYLVFGFFVRVLGVALMVHYRSAGHSAIALLTCQILQGIGGGALALTTQVSVQIAVEPSKVARVTAFELLTTDLGAAAGSTLASVMVTAQLPSALASHLPTLPRPELEHIQGSLEAVLLYPPGTPIRTGIANAWSHVMRWLCALSVAVQLPALAFAILMPDLDLHEHRHPPVTTTPAPAEQTAPAPPSIASPPAWQTVRGAIGPPVSGMRYTPIP